MSDYQFENAGYRIHCETAGSASSDKAIIFLHGLASNASRWRELITNLTLKDDCYLLAMDLRGHGRSMTYDHYDRADWCSDVNKLMDEMAKDTILVGHSMGAQIALDLASQDPTRLHGLLLIDPVFPQALTGVLKKVARLRWVVAAVTIFLRLIHRLGLGRKTYPYRDLQKLDLETRDYLNQNPDKNIADLYMNPFSDLEYIPLVNYLQDQFEVTRKLPALDNITTPVMVLLSSGASTSDVGTNRKILNTIPELEIKTIEADHWLLTEKPLEARDVIEAWCKKKLAL